MKKGNGGITEQQTVSRDSEQNGVVRRLIM